MLAELGNRLSLPIIIAGDFNADIYRSSLIQKSLKLKVYFYYPTKRRTDNKTVDFFLFRPHPHQNDDTKLSCVASEIPDDDIPCEELQDICNHDPLNAVLQVIRITANDDDDDDDDDDLHDLTEKFKSTHLSSQKRQAS